MNTAKDAKEKERERGTSERPNESTGKLKQRGSGANLYGIVVENFRTNFHTNFRTYFGVIRGKRQITSELLVQLEEAVSQGEDEPSRACVEAALCRSSGERLMTSICHELLPLYPIH